jgi:hypothetical protein
MDPLTIPAETAEWQQLVDAHDPDGTCDCAECDQGTCPDCGQPLEDTGTEWCSRNGEYICPGCHHESGCGCRG